MIYVYHRNVILISPKSLDCCIHEISLNVSLRIFVHMINNKKNYFKGVMIYNIFSKKYEFKYLQNTVTHMFDSFF